MCGHVTCRRIICQDFERLGLQAVGRILPVLALVPPYDTLGIVRIYGGGVTSGYILSLSFKGLKGEIIAHGMEDKGILIGLGSACSTHVRSNRVLSAMGIDKEYAQGSVRISFSPFCNIEDAMTAADALEQVTSELRIKMGR